MDKKLTVAFFTETYFPLLNGVTASVDSFAIYLRKRGHTVYIFAPKVDDFVSDDPNVFYLPSVKGIATAPQFRLPSLVQDENYKKIQELNFDLVHAHGYGGFALLGYQAARKKKVPYILTFHTLLSSYTHYFLNGKVITPKMTAVILRFLASLCDGVISPSQKMKDALMQFGVSKPISVVPNVIDPTLYSQKKSDMLRQKLGLSKDALILLSVGRLGKEKNFSFLLKMFRHIHKKDKRIHLVIVGDGAEEKVLHTLADEYNISTHVHLVGREDSQDMPLVYASSDIFVFSSVSEVHPMVILEAAASGLPFVVVDDMSFDGLVHDGINGYRSRLNQKQFSTLVMDLVSNTKKRKVFGKKSHEILTKNFSPDGILYSLEEYYEKILSGALPKTQSTKGLMQNNVTEKLRQTLKTIDAFFQGR